MSDSSLQNTGPVPIIYRRRTVVFPGCVHSAYIGRHREIDTLYAAMRRRTPLVIAFRAQPLAERGKEDIAVLKDRVRELRALAKFNEFQESVGKAYEGKAAKEYLHGFYDAEKLVDISDDELVEELELVVPPEDCNIGTLCNVASIFKRPEGTVKVVFRGHQRVDISDTFEDESGQLMAYFTNYSVQLPDEPVVATAEYIEFRRLLEVFVTYDKSMLEKVLDLMQHADPIQQLDALVPYFIPNDTDLLYRLLSEQSFMKQLSVFNEVVRNRIAQVKLQGINDDSTFKYSVAEYYRIVGDQVRKVNGPQDLIDGFMEVKERMTYGRCSEEQASEMNKIEHEIEDSEKFPKVVKDLLLVELSKMKRMPAMGAETTVSRNYIDWLMALPWNTYTPEFYDLVYARQILDSDHYGLEKAKERILEHIAVQALVGKPSATILCLAGPPGVGKTSLGRSIARATKRSFVRVSLGGVGDHSEIRGHRRTYIGSMPGKIISALRRAGTSNPVMLLDEVDKLGADYRGDPAAALLEVLDPEQNDSFVDHFIDIEYDLSSVLFICTANDISPIHPALRDRMEIFELSGYTQHEKTRIARDHLIPKQLKSNGIEDLPVEFTDDALVSLCHNYTREAGVRNLEREIGRVCRKLVFTYVGGESKKSRKSDVQLKADALLSDVCGTDDAVPTSDRPPLTLDDLNAQFQNGNEPESDEVEQYGRVHTPPKGRCIKVDWPTEPLILTAEKITNLIGHPTYSDSKIDALSQIGVTNGLAWSSVGGTLLIAEALTMPGKGELIVTGKLGEVMQESARAAMSYARSRAAVLGLPEDFHKKLDIHVHFPEGAIPKDGPSAGVTMTVSIISALTQIPVDHHVAMTGEVTLRGRVLRIGGLKEKVIAAHRAGIRTVLIPHENLRDVEEFPEEVREAIEIIPIKTVDEALRHALVEDPMRDRISNTPQECLVPPM